MTIGIFDSGLGGEMVASRLARHFPNAKLTIISDREHLPYGSRSNDEIYKLTKQAIQSLVGKCDVLVIACNTATAAAIDQLRTDYPKQRFVGYEPMVKPAAQQTKSGIIAILATPATLISSRYKNLVAEFGSDIRIIAPDVSTWAAKIEVGTAGSINLDQVAAAVHAGADVIVLACTHYLALESKLRQQFPTVKVIEPTSAVADRITAISQLQQ